MYAHKLKSFLDSATGRLGMSYLLIIMIMSIGFSFVFYNASAHELGRQLPSPTVLGVRRYEDFRIVGGQRVDEFFIERIAEGRHALLVKLLILNGVVLVWGSAISYYLARRTLQPIEENMEAQAQFVSDASHELRTPLTALQTTNEVALRRKKISSSDASAVFKQNINEVMKLQQLTDSLLQLSRQDGGDIKLSAVALPLVVSDAINVVLTQAMQKKAVIDDTIPNLSVLAHQQSLTQALVTILDNAIKYGPVGGTVSITGRAASKQALLTVSDQGPGIDKKHIPHIFDRFYRANQSRNQKYDQGYGIGLALAKKIIDQHLGEITVESRKGKGAKFTIKLPLA